ncbi:hypothetical protein D8674_025357 [Pyrus ussuriensis x Pyrus communis]|uniref:Uncharacterized protein n=1 Tax=Pyrus ussuriensis x Pyrus communis TaxID=2448454 RepID=A0A5N5H5E3_9ROSA|nr:hypothetical protein D8674_025357 [Pyrus ussuriensis x Pyrus communis]
MIVGLTEAQEREACVESFLPSPSQTTEYESSYLVMTTGHCKFQFLPEFGGVLLVRWERRKMDIALLVLLYPCLSVKSLHLSCSQERYEVAGLAGIRISTSIVRVIKRKGNKRKVDGFLGQDDLPCLPCLACPLYHVIFLVLILRAKLLLVPQVRLVFIRIYGVILSTDMRASRVDNVL